MKNQSYATSFRVSKSPKEVFEAINNVRGWWSSEIEGKTDELGAEFTFQYEDVHRSTQRIVEFVPGKRVVWKITESRLGFIEDKTEWNGTEVIFEICEAADETELRFTHIGLVPAIACYEGCSGAWGFFINESLYELVATGKGQPLERKVAKLSA